MTPDEFKRRVTNGARGLMLEGYEKGAQDMRARAAHLAATVYEGNPPHAGWDICGRYIGDAIMALALNAKKPGHPEG